MNYSLFLDKHKYKIALFVFLAYFCLSLYKIDHSSLWYDECFSIDWANDSIPDIIKFSLKDINPPLYLIILHYWMNLFGESEIALRSLSSFGASVGCAVMFLYALRFFNWQTAIFATLLFFSSNELYYYSQEGRTYGLVIMFTMLSNFAYMSLIKNPNYKNALLLGLFNSIIFYLHTLASFVFIGQILLIPFLTFNRSLLTKEHNQEKSFLGFKLKHIIYYVLSWVLFILLFLPWKDRLIELLTKKQTVVWSSKPTLIEFKNCLFDFHNSEILFYVYLSVLVVLFAVIIFLKKYRDESFNYKLILVPLIVGPFLLWLNYILAVTITPIFVKRYVLFTILGFILLYAYSFSLLKINFKYKMIGFLVLIIFSFINLKIPRVSAWDFREGVALIMKEKTSTSYITTDIPMMFSYYIDRKKIFKQQEGHWRDDLLKNYGVYPIYDMNWVNTTDFSKFTDIYYSRSFAVYTDPEKKIDNSLNSKFILIKDTSMKGISISHYRIVSPDIIKNAEESIKSDTAWYHQIINKAKQRNVSVDSMLTLDALWLLKNKK